MVSVSYSFFWYEFKIHIVELIPTVPESEETDANFTNMP